MDLVATERRRPIQFDDLSEVMPDVVRLGPRCRTLARWSFAQICKHLADSVNGSIDGFDLSRHRLKRFFCCRQMLRYTLRYGIPPDYTVDPNIEPAQEVNPDDAVGQLARAIERYLAHRGRLQPHPLFGGMSREKWSCIHRIHCAHHLSFVIPVDG